MVEQAYGYAFILAAHAAARAAGAPWLKNMYSASCGTARRSVRRFQVAKDNADVGRVFDLLERKFWLPDKCLARVYGDTPDRPRCSPGVGLRGVHGRPSC